ncbi:N6-adenosine-methyltransferase subunit METTL14 [Hibiscus syriacus]|uniref:N6-adenosine-methyltransferase subunit METTL14 n=1 Tax=Hibiscus syriacus TaxID=106335 RepID=A0A6A2YGE0_HIBSY|nr:N6-adenosine-methyltransferase subunit METTL14 [Hibiscus syriacus]
MDSPERWEAIDSKKKHKSSKSRKTSNVEEGEGVESGSGRRRSSGDRSESRKRSGASTRADTDEEDCDAQKPSRSKQIRRKQEESSLEKLSSWYQDGEAESRQDGAEKSSVKDPAWADETNIKKVASKLSRSKEERSHDGEVKKSLHRDSRKAEESNYEKPDLTSGKTSGLKYDTARENSASARNEPSESKSIAADSNDEKSAKSSCREERRIDSEKSKTKGRSDALEEDNRASPLNREDRSGREKIEKHRQQRTPGRDVDSRERTYNMNDDGVTSMRDKSSRREGKQTDPKAGLIIGVTGVGIEKIQRRTGKGGNRVIMIKIPKMETMHMIAAEIGICQGMAGKGMKTRGLMNYDVIEIQTKPLDYGRAESGSNFPRKTEIGQQSDMKSAPNEEVWGYMQENRGRRSDAYGSGLLDEGQKLTLSGRGFGGQSSSAASQPPYGNQDVGTFGCGSPQGMKGSRTGGGRGRSSGRDNQHIGLAIPMMGSPFAHIGMPPPGPMQQINPSMSPAPGPPISPGVFIPPFSPVPVVWHGPRAVDMNMLGVPPGVSPVPPGPWFPPNMGGLPNPGMDFNQSGPGRGPSNLTVASFNGAGPMGQGTPPERISGGWNLFRELELTNVLEDYPKLRELIRKKDEIVAISASPPMYMKCDLREFELSPDFFGTKFDVILIDPPWEEYVHRAPGVADHIEYWTFEEIMNLKIEAIADTPSFIFLWVGDGVGLEQGRQCLKKWGFRRCEDICWVKTNKTNSTPSLRLDSHSIFQHSKEHCLMGIKGTVRRSTDGSTQKPEDMYRIIEHFALGRRRLELFGEDHNIRSGWLTIGKGLSSSNFNAEIFIYLEDLWESYARIRLLDMIARYGFFNIKEVESNIAFGCCETQAAMQTL